MPAVGRARWSLRERMPGRDIRLVADNRGRERDATHRTEADRHLGGCVQRSSRTPMRENVLPPRTEAKVWLVGIGNLRADMGCTTRTAAAAAVVCGHVQLLGAPAEECVSLRQRAEQELVCRKLVKHLVSSLDRSSAARPSLSCYAPTSAVARWLARTSERPSSGGRRLCQARSCRSCRWPAGAKLRRAGCSPVRPRCSPSSCRCRSGRCRT
jgi:hypothetical protein